MELLVDLVEVQGMRDMGKWRHLFPQTLFMDSPLVDEEKSMYYCNNSLTGIRLIWKCNCDWGPTLPSVVPTPYHSLRLIIFKYELLLMIWDGCRMYILGRLLPPIVYSPYMGKKQLSKIGHCWLLVLVEWGSIFHNIVALIETTLLYFPYLEYHSCNIEIHLFIHWEIFEWNETR